MSLVNEKVRKDNHRGGIDLIFFNQEGDSRSDCHSRTAT